MADEQNNPAPNQDDQATLEKLQSDLDSAMSGWKRAAADFENYKKRKEAENKELVEFAREFTVAKLLPTIDALEQALRHLPQLAGQPAQQPIGGIAEAQFSKQYQNWQTGINGIVAQLDKVLAELGVKKIQSLGKKFDPYFHEAVREQESEQEDGIIIDELQTGFELNGKVIRPSQVVISKKINSDPNAGN